jgi:hypothetical protein
MVRGGMDHIRSSGMNVMTEKAVKSAKEDGIKQLVRWKKLNV